MSSSKNSTIKKRTLKNGLRILTIPQKGTQAVTVLVLVGTGSKYEKKKQGGISHFLEHMFFKGTKKRPTPISVSEPLDEIGGIFNAFTGEEYTGYFAKVDKAHAELALDWVSDIFLNSLMPKNEIAKEKGVVIEELNMHKDVPMTFVQILWNRLLYGDQPAGRDIVGTKESIQGFSKDDIVSYMNHQYVASNTLVCIAGNIKRDAIERQAIKVFKDIGTSEPLRKPAVIERQTTPEVLVEYRKTDQTHLNIGVRGYNLFHKKRFAQELLAVILGGMMSSRLFIEIREKLGIAYYISAVSESDPDVGYLVVQAGIKNENTAKAITTILKEFKKMAQHRVLTQELNKVKENVKGKMALGLESSDSKASFFGLQELLEHRIFTLEEMYDKIDAVTASDIQKVAQDLFCSEKLNLVVLGPFKNKTPFKKLLTL